MKFQKVTCIIEARMSSTRLPGKVLMDCVGIPMIQHQVNRVSESQNIDEVIIATTINSNDDILVDYCKKNIKN